MARLALLAIFLLGCGEDEGGEGPTRGSRVTVTAPEGAEGEDEVDPNAPPTRGGARPPFEVVIQAVAEGEHDLATGERMAVLTSVAPGGEHVSMIDLETGLVRATRPAAPSLEVHEISPRARGVLFVPSHDVEADDCVWDLAGDALTCVPGSSDEFWVGRPAFSAEGNSFAYLARRGEGPAAELRVFRLGSARARTIGTIDDAIDETELYFHPRGIRILVASALGHLVDARSGRVLVDTPPPARARPFDPSGRFLVTFAPEGIEIRNARSGAVLRTVATPTEQPAIAIAWSPRGEHFCFGRTLVTTASGETRELAEDCGDELTRDGAVVARQEPRHQIDLTGPAHVDRQTNQRTAIAEYDVPHIDGLITGAGGVEISWTAGQGSARRRWVMTGEERREVAEPPWFFSENASRAAIDPERRVVWVQHDLSRTTDLTDLPAGIDLGCHWQEDAGWRLVCGARPIFSVDHRHVALGPNVFDAASGARIGVLAAPDVPFLARAQRIVQGSALYDTAGARIAAVAGTARAFSPDGALLAIADRRRIDIVSSDRGQRDRQLRAPEPVVWIAWDEPAFLLMLSTQGDLIRLSADDGAVVSRTQIGTPRGQDPQRRRLVLCAQGLVHLFSTSDGIQRGPLGRCPARGEFVVPTEGPFVAWTDGMRARVHRISDGEVLEITPFDGGTAVASTDSGWFEGHGIPHAQLRLRTGTIQRGRLRRAERSNRARPGLVAEFLAGSQIFDPP